MPARQVALIGVGMVAAAYVDALKQLAGTVRLRGALGASAQSSREFCARVQDGFDGRLTAYRDVEQVAGDAEVAFAIVATPPNARRHIAAVLSAARKPVLMEKPLERNYPNAAKIVAAFEDAQVPLGIMFQHRVRPAAAALAGLLRERDFGALAAVEIAVPWWRDQAYYDQPGRGTYARDGGGVLISQAIHTLDLALQFTGPVAAVQALCATTALHRMEAEDFAAAGLQFASGAVGTLFASTGCYPGRSEQLVLHYQNCSASLQSNLLELSWHDGRRETVGAQAASGAGADPMAFTSDWHRAMIADFDEAVQAGRAPRATGRSGLAVQQLIGALERSAREGCAVQLDRRPEQP